METDLYAEAVNDCIDQLHELRKTNDYEIQFVWALEKVEASLKGLLTGHRCMNTALADSTAARDAVLEEAAQACNLRGTQYGLQKFYDKQSATDYCAGDIRAMKSQKGE